MEDYLLSNRYFLAAHRWKLALYRLLKGKRFISAVMDFMEARPEYLSAAFQALEREHGSFENYLRVRCEQIICRPPAPGRGAGGGIAHGRAGYGGGEVVNGCKTDKRIEQRMPNG
ncbi:MAG: tyrosine-protein phosphatase [Chloroflexota bacterium]